MKNLTSTPRDGVRRYSWGGGTMPKVLQLYKQEKFLEKWLKILIPDFHLQKYDSEERWQKCVYLTRISVNATLSDLRSRLWETTSNWSRSEEKSSAAVEFELSDKPNPRVINSFSVIHEFSKLKRWVTVEEFTSTSSLISNRKFEFASI